ncbi:hypothetical protein [Homoserinibacter sp. GY 40078]|uniref:hypothetical protein n=1 Tax=Homoserinibacter sp. GY 40078 TaxID=2603275 RepID=UPI0011DA59A3|nr:hypothetical protein [Homoserinibacter sp. GY 40078]TXK19315.1 hypothetical protein FVQ89_05215 [Homoserinibacter sp. GY 40078]
MEEQFELKAPPAGTDFVDYVYTYQLDWGELGIDESGQTRATDVGIGGRTSTLIYAAEEAGGEGVLGLIVMGYSSPAGWGSRSAEVYSCLTVTFDLVGGSAPEYADADCINQLRGSIATDTHVTLATLRG